MRNAQPGGSGEVLPVDLGIAEFVPDPRRNGWTLLVDGIAQSYVDMDRPEHLEFEYLHRLVAMVDALTPPPAALRVLHLGGGGMTLARYLAATRPGSSQRVVERDRALCAAVLRILPLRPDSDILVQLGDAADLDQVTDSGPYDLIVVDVYLGATMPARVSTVEFAVALRPLLSTGGLVIVNVADVATLHAARAQAATLRAAFADVCLIGEPAVPPGRRFGNVLLAAAAAPGGLPLANAADPGDRLPTSGADPHDRLPTSGADPGDRLPTSAADPHDRLPTSGADPGDRLPTSGADPGDRLPTSGADPGGFPPTGSRPGSARPGLTLVHGADLDSFIAETPPPSETRVVEHGPS